ANLLADIFYFTSKESTSSVFAGSGFEIMKKKYLGEHGHIAIATNNINRAIAYLNRKGIATLPETAKESGGKLKAIYLDLNISGFAIHLMQK
nr:keto-hydroxyglutarate-aldolase/keto-deoxy-phosphogluconate aldolase [Atribacterota bacterium]